MNPDQHMWAKYLMSLGLSRLGYPDKCGRVGLLWTGMREAQKEEGNEATSKLLGICLAAVAKACAAPVGESGETEKCPQVIASNEGFQGLRRTSRRIEKQRNREMPAAFV
jgi:hypothetical protein